MKAADGGAVLFAERDRGRRYVLAAEKAGQCGLPKDRLEPGESERQAALREIWEECGAKAALLPGFRREVSYPVGDAVKGVSFFLGRCEARRLRSAERWRRACCWLMRRSWSA